MAPTKPRPRSRGRRPTKDTSKSDVLLDVLTLARAEGSLEGRALGTFAEALRERAGLILEERVRRQDERVEALEAENAWRRETMARLEESVSELQSEAERLRGQHREATAAHDALHGHHRDLTRKLAAELATLAALPLLRSRQIRNRLATLAKLLRSEAQ